MAALCGAGRRHRPRLAPAVAMASDAEIARRREARERWQAGVSPAWIGADMGVTGREIRHWIQWCKRKFAASKSVVWNEDSLRQRQRMLELRNAGQSWDLLAQQYGVTTKTKSEYLRRARKEAELGVGGLGAGSGAAARMAVAAGGVFRRYVLGGIAVAGRGGDGASGGAASFAGQAPAHGVAAEERQAGAAGQ